MMAQPTATLKMFPQLTALQWIFRRQFPRLAVLAAPNLPVTRRPLLAMDVRWPLRIGAVPVTRPVGPQPSAIFLKRFGTILRPKLSLRAAAERANFLPRPKPHGRPGRACRTMVSAMFLTSHLTLPRLTTHICFAAEEVA